MGDKRVTEGLRRMSAHAEMELDLQYNQVPYIPAPLDDSDEPWEDKRVTEGLRRMSAHAEMELDLQYNDFVYLKPPAAGVEFDDHLYDDSVEAPSYPPSCDYQRPPSYAAEPDDDPEMDL